jgi:peptidoglycan/LPS O-acetylase OafA/YrhL
MFFAVCVMVSHAVLLGGFDEYYFLRVWLSSETAVQAFFIISGFLVLKSFEGSAGPAEFYRRRFFRIYPAYAAVVLVCCFAGYGYAQAAAILVSGRDVFTYLAANLGLLNFLAPTLGDLFATNVEPEVNGALWSIKVEVGFYALVPLLAIVGRRLGWLNVGAAVMVCGVVWRPLLELLATRWHWASHPSLAHQLPGQLSFFGMGMVLYVVATKRAEIRWGAMVFCGVLVMAVLLGQARMAALMGGLAALILIAIGLPQSKLFDRRVDLSYGIYLWHFPIIQFLVVFGAAEASFWVYFILAALLTALAAWASWRLIEKPSMRLGSGVVT